MTKYYEDKLKVRKTCPICNSSRYNNGYCKKCGYWNKDNKDIILR